MRYLHYITENKTDNQIESLYSNDNKPRFSFKCFANKKYSYKIWDREENIVTKIK